jgi:hypothetical protein
VERVGAIRESACGPPHLIQEAPREGEGEGWRKLAVEVRSEEILVFWEGDCFGKTSRAEIENLTRSMLGDMAASGTLAWQGGLGLYAEAATASFKNVVISPLPRMGIPAGQGAENK